MSNTSPKLSAIGRLDIGGETTFGDEAANFDYLRSMVIDPSSLTVEAIRDEHMRQADYEVAKVLGRYNGTLTTTHYLHGFQSTVPSSAPTMTDSSQAGANAFHHLAAVLASALGNFSMGGFVQTATIGATGAPTDSITIDDASGGLSSFGDGEPIAWVNAAGDEYYVNWLTDIATGADPDVGTLLQTTPPFDPQGSVAWGGAPTIWAPGTATMDAYSENASNGHSLNQPATSWSLKLIRHDADDVIECYGCQPIGVKISLPIGQLPTIEITWGVAHWAEQGSGGTPSVGTYSFPNPEPVVGWYAAWGATSATSLILKSLEIDFGITRNPMEDGAGTSGVGGWFTAKRDPTVSFSVYRDYSEEVTLFTNQTGSPFTFQHGTQPGKMLAVCIPNARVSEFPGPTDDAGAVMASVTLLPNYYSGDTDAASDIIPSNSPFRIAFI